MEELNLSLANAVNLFNAGRLGDMDVACNEILARWPNQSFALYMLAASANRQHDFRRAIQLADAALAGNSENAECLMEKALAHVTLGETQAAGEACHKALAIAKTAHTIGVVHSILSQVQMPGDLYSTFLSRFHEWLKPRNYVEIGVAAGGTIVLANPPTIAVGIDPVPSIRSTPARTATKIYPLPSDQYFATRDLRADIEGEVVDFSFIDGLHLFEQALRDFINIEKYADHKTTVLFHDCLPVDRLCAAREPTDFWAGDVWKVVVLLDKYRPDLELFTIPTRPSGLSVVVGLDPNSTVLADNFDRIVSEFMNLELPLDEAERWKLLKVIDNNDWEEVRARVEKRRNAPAPKATAKKTAKLAPAGKTAVKKSAAKAPVSKRTTKKTVAKTPLSKAVVKKTAAKAPAAKAPAGKAAAQKAAAQAPAGKAAAKKPAAKAPLSKAAAKKPAAKAPVGKVVVKKTAAKAPAGKVAANKPVAKAPARKAAAKRA